MKTLIIIFLILTVFQAFEIYKENKENLVLNKSEINKIKNKPLTVL